MKFADIIYYVLMYFALLMVIWGYAIAFYFGETGVFQFSAGTSRTPEDIFQFMAAAENAWGSTDLLKEGQRFEYAITTDKNINLSYEIMREFGGGFLVLGKAYIESRAYGGEYKIIKGARRAEDRFVVDKTTGAPKAATYTATFWGSGLCYPPKFYFHGRPLTRDAKWDVFLPKENVSINVVGAESVLGYECSVCKLGSATLAVCKEIPLLAKYEGKWCYGGGIKTVLLNHKT